MNSNAKLKLMKRPAVFCGSIRGFLNDFEMEAKILGDFFIQNNIAMVYGREKWDHMVNEGFLKQENRAMICIDESVEGLYGKDESFCRTKKTKVINKVAIK